MHKLQKKHKYLLMYFVYTAAMISLGMVVNVNDGNYVGWLAVLTGGFGGNLLAGAVGGLVFIPLAIFLDTQTEEKLKYVKEATEHREKILEEERNIRHFEEFLKEQTYHDVRFPEIRVEQNSIGLEYLIRSVRVPKTQIPLVKESEMETLNIILVDHPSNIEVLQAEDLRDYDDSSIRENEYYFCKFFNGDWHMSLNGISDWHRFYLSSKMGQVETVITANEFMEKRNAPLGDMKLMITLKLKQDGTKLVGSGGFIGYDLYRDATGGVHLKVSNCLSKRVYLTNLQRSYDELAHWVLVIENLRGYASRSVRENITAAVKTALDELMITPQKIPWYDLPDHLQMRPLHPTY